MLVLPLLATLFPPLYNTLDPQLRDLRERRRDAGRVHEDELFNADGTITVVKEHFGGSGFPLSELGIDTTYSIYAGFLAILANLVVCAVATLPPTRVTRGCATSRR